MKVFLNLENGVPENNVQVITEGSLLRIKFDFCKQEVDKNNEQTGSLDNAYTAEGVDVLGSQKYDDIVSAIVEERYPSDKMDAIRLNYELSQNSEFTIAKAKASEYIEEYKTMQEWRIHAKEIASKVVELINK